MKGGGRFPGLSHPAWGEGEEPFRIVFNLVSAAPMTVDVVPSLRSGGVLVKRGANASG
jgi:hypothetical protein